MSWARIEHSNLLSNKTFARNITYTHSSGENDLSITTYKEDDETEITWVSIQFSETSPPVLEKKYSEAGLSRYYGCFTLLKNPTLATQLKLSAENIKKIIDIFIHHHNLVGSEIHAELYAESALGNPIEIRNFNLLEMVNSGNIDEAIHTAIAYQKNEEIFFRVF